MRRKFFSFTPFLLALILLLSAGGCQKGEEKGKTEKAPEQKVSQLQSFALPPVTNDLDFNVEGTEEKDGIIRINGWAAIKNQDGMNTSNVFGLAITESDLCIQYFFFVEKAGRNSEI